MDEIAKWFNYKRLTVGVEKERHSDMCAKQHTCYCAIDVARQWHSEIRLKASATTTSAKSWMKY